MNVNVLLGVIGPWEGVLIVVALLLLFGGSKIPGLMKGLGQGMKEFKKAAREDEPNSKPANPEKEIEERK